MNHIINKFLLAGDNFITGKIERNRRFTTYLSKRTRQSLLSTWHGDYGDLYKRKDSDKVLHDKAFTIAKNVKY